MAGIGIGSAGAPVNTPQITVGTSPTLLINANSYRVSITFVNTSSATIWISNDPNVATSGAHIGFPLLAGSSWSSSNRNAFYAVVATGTQPLNFAEESNP